MPMIGDRIFVAGRWIIDNGHADRHMEMHTPHVLVRYFQVKEGEPFRTFANQGEFTGEGERVGVWAGSEEEAAIDVIIFVSGAWLGEPVSFDIFPPVRTSSQAVPSLKQHGIHPVTPLRLVSPGPD